MNETKVLKSLMVTFKETIWDLAERLGVDYLMLVNIMLNDAPADQDLKGRIINLAVDHSLCPECGLRTINAGSCTHCLCGWEMCG